MKSKGSLERVCRQNLTALNEPIKSHLSPARMEVPAAYDHMMTESFIDEENHIQVRAKPEGHTHASWPRHQVDTPLNENTTLNLRGRLEHTCLLEYSTHLSQGQTRPRVVTKKALLLRRQSSCQRLAQGAPHRKHMTTFITHELTVHQPTWSAWSQATP